MALIRSLLLKRQMRAPTPTPSFLSLIAQTLRSSRTLRPSLSVSRSRRRFLSTSGPATPRPHMNSPDCRSTLQHSFGRMLADTSEESLGRRWSERFKRMLTSDQWSRRAARCVRVRYMPDAGGVSVCNEGLRGKRYFIRSWEYLSRRSCSRGSSESMRRWRHVYVSVSAAQLYTNVVCLLGRPPPALAHPRSKRLGAVALLVRTGSLPWSNLCCPCLCVYDFD